FGACGEEDGGVRDRCQGPIAVGLGIDRAILDDEADNVIAVCIGALEDNDIGIDVGECAAATGAIVVRGDDELLGRVDRLAVILKIDNPVGIGVGFFLAVGRIFRGLGEIDLVGDPVDDVVI